MRTRWFWVIWAWLGLLLPASSAFAEASDESLTVGLTSDARPLWLERDEPERHAGEIWYGWQTLTTDGLALTGLVAAGLLTDVDYPNATGLALLTSLGVYVLGAPIVHAAHANWGTAASSLALRLLPIGTGTATFVCSNERCAYPLAALTFMACLLSIMVDSAVLAYEDAPKRPEPQLVVGAWLDRSGGGITLGDAF